jgi:Uma2 family endonuclease
MSVIDMESPQILSDRDAYFAAGNLKVYYSPKQIKSGEFCGPDFFAVLGTEKKEQRS